MTATRGQWEQWVGEARVISDVASGSVESLHHKRVPVWRSAASCWGLEKCTLRGGYESDGRAMVEGWERHQYFELFRQAGSRVGSSWRSSASLALNWVVMGGGGGS